MNAINSPSNEQLAALAKAIAHPARIQIIRLLLTKPSCIGGGSPTRLALLNQPCRNTYEY